MRALRFSILLPLLVCSACASDPVGSWRASSACGDWKLDVSDDTADATVHNQSQTGDCLSYGYDVVWEGVASGWEFDMECDQGDCATLLPSLPAGDPGDLSMFCVFPENSEGDEDSDIMDCKVRQPKDMVPSGFVDVVWERTD